MDKTSKLYAERLIGLIADLGVPYRQESSLRFCRAYLGANRFVLTVTPEQVRRHQAGQLLEICRRLEMPEIYLTRVLDALDDGSRLHFGFEEALGKFVFKMELEQAAPVHPEAAAVPMHQSFRWGLGNPAASASRFVWLPEVSPARIPRRVEGIYCGVERPPRTLARALAAWSGPVRYLEEEEEGWGRRAFHLEFPEGGPRLEQWRALIEDAGVRYQVPPGMFGRILGKLHGRLVLRVAGGFRHDGHDFLTLSYGIES